MNVRVVTRWAELEAHYDEWWALLERSSASEPTLSPLWMEAWWQVFGHEDGRELRAVLVYESGRLVGLAPLLVRTVRHRRVIPLRRLELIASGEPAADEICSDYLGFIAERGKEEGVARAVAESICGASLGRWDELVLDNMPADTRMTEQIIGALRGASLPVELVDLRPCPYTPLPARWDEYTSSLASSDRYMLRRTMRDLEAWAGGELVVERAETQADLERGRRILIELHGQRWAEDGKPGVFGSRRFLRFHELVMPRLLERGQLDLMWLSCKGEPIAATYNIVWGNKVYFYQCGRRMDLPAKVRPGIAMHVYAMQHAIAQGRTCYDFLSGVLRYKKQLALAEAPLIQVRATRPGSPAALLRRWALHGEALVREIRDRLRARLRPSPDTPAAGTSTPAS